MKKVLFLTVMSLLLLSSCSVKQAASPIVATAYYLSDNSDIVAKEVELQDADNEELVRELYFNLTSPTNKKLTPAISQSVRLSEIAFYDSVCELHISSYYTSLSPSDRATFDTCIVKSLCSLPFIEEVTLVAGEQVFRLSPDNFITEVPTISYDTTSVNLYYANSDFTDMAISTVELPLSTDNSLEFLVVSKLFDSSPDGLTKSVFPNGTKLNNVYVHDDCCYIDLSREFAENAIHEELTEKITLFSIVDTITGLPGINEVAFLIDGNEGYGYTYYDISSPLRNQGSLN